MGSESSHYDAPYGETRNAQFDGAVNIEGQKCTQLALAESASRLEQPGQSK